MSQRRDRSRSRSRRRVDTPGAIRGLISSLQKFDPEVTAHPDKLEKALLAHILAEDQVQLPVSIVDSEKHRVITHLDDECREEYIKDLRQDCKTRQDIINELFRTASQDVPLKIQLDLSTKELQTIKEEHTKARNQCEDQKREISELQEKLEKCKADLQKSVEQFNSNMEAVSGITTIGPDNYESRILIRGSNWAIARVIASLPRAVRPAPETIFSSTYQKTLAKRSDRVGSHKDHKERKVLDDHLYRIRGGSLVEKAYLVAQRSPQYKALIEGRQWLDNDNKCIGCGRLNHCTTICIQHPTPFSMDEYADTQQLCRDCMQPHVKCWLTRCPAQKCNECNDNHATFRCTSKPLRDLRSDYLAVVETFIRWKLPADWDKIDTDKIPDNWMSDTKLSNAYRKNQEMLDNMEQCQVTRQYRRKIFNSRAPVDPPM